MSKYLVAGTLLSALCANPPEPGIEASRTSSGRTASTSWAKNPICFSVSP
ncbi:MAG: hypothetical protein NZ519_12810 [Bacteroidia bacterium]|nr:hypothetical protein [Bacteroidia bacterium]